MTRGDASKKQRKAPGDYRVGYGKPPVEHQWKPGQSGRRGVATKKPATIADTLKAKLMARVPVDRGDRRRYMTMQDLIIEQLVRDAAKGDARARALLFSLLVRHEGTDETVIDPGLLSADDQELIDAYLANGGHGRNALGAAADPDTADAKEGDTADTPPSPMPPTDDPEKSS